MQLLYWTITELMRLTRKELCDLYAGILDVLPDFEAGSLERTYALMTLDNIRKVLRLRQDFRP